MRGVEIERAHVTYIQQIPAYTLALFHGHHRPIGVEVSVDGKLEVGLGESGAREREVSLRIGKVGALPLERFLVGGADVGGNILLRIPTLVFVKCGEESDDFAVDVFGSAIWVSLASPGHDDGPHQAGSYVFVFVDARLVRPDDRAGIVRPRP